MSETENVVQVIRTDVESLTTEQFAEKQGVTIRTVRRWLADDEVRGAWQDPISLKWTIPSNAYRQIKPKDEERGRPVQYVHLPAAAPEPGNGLVLHSDAHRQLEAPAEPTRLEDLAEEPAFLRIEDAAAYLGIPQAQILANPELFDVMHVGVNASPRVPKSTIKRFEG